MVGAPGFEPGASCAQGRRATRLRYAPTVGMLLIVSQIRLPSDAMSHGMRAWYNRLVTEGGCQDDPPFTPLVNLPDTLDRRSDGPYSSCGACTARWRDGAWRRRRAFCVRYAHGAGGAQKPSSHISCSVSQRPAGLPKLGACLLDRREWVEGLPEPPVCVPFGLGIFSHEVFSVGFWLLAVLGLGFEQLERL